MKKILLIAITIFGLLSCKSPNKILLGSWDNKNGQILEFKENGEAFWIFYTESEKGTFAINYKFDPLALPKQLDLTDFKIGPLKGKTLYGIIEFQNENSFRFDCEPSASNRPETFSPTQTQTYYRKQ